MIALHKRLTEKQIRKDAKDLILQLQEFFVKNPRRRTATTSVWYGAIVKIRKKHIEKDVETAVISAINC